MGTPCSEWSIFCTMTCICWQTEEEAERKEEQELLTRRGREHPVKRRKQEAMGLVSEASVPVCMHENS